METPRSQLVKFFPFEIPRRIKEKKQRTNSPAHRITSEEQSHSGKDNWENNSQYNSSSMEKHSLKVNKFWVLFTKSSICMSCVVCMGYQSMEIQMKKIHIEISSRELTFQKIIEGCKTRTWPRIPKMQKEWHDKKNDNGNTMKYQSYPSWIEYLEKKTLKI